MNYGSAPYGSSSLGGAAASEWFTFFTLTSRDPGTFEATLEFAGSEPFYSIFAQSVGGTIGGLFEAFTYNDPSETPQSQGVFGGDFGFLQSVIGSARFITVRATMSNGSNFSVRGRAGD